MFPLDRSEQRQLHELEKSKETVYGGVEYESERKIVEAQYDALEKVYNEYVEKKKPSQEVAKELGEASLGLHGEHPSTQVYAYELLFKSLAEAGPQEEVFTDEIIFDGAYARATSPSVLREYFLGLLAYHVSYEREQTRQQELQNNPSSAKLQAETKIFQALRKALSKFQNSSIQEQRELADLIQNDFPHGTEEGDTGRLIANYYEKAIHPMVAPEPQSRIIEQGVGGRGGKGSGVPHFLRRLPIGTLPSDEKIEEAKQHGIDLFTSLARERDGVINSVLFDRNVAEAMDYIERMRQLKNTSDFAGMIALHHEYRQTLWNQLDRRAQEFFGSSENLYVEAQTIQDYPASTAGKGSENSEVKTQPSVSQ